MSYPIKRDGRALIIGGGIAGPVLGMWLVRLGLQVELCEQRGPGAAREGAFLGVAPNGMNVLAELGLAEAVAACGVPCSAFQFQNAAGAGIGAIDRSADERRFGASLVMLRRGDLNQVLLDAAARAGVVVRWRRRLVRLEQGAGAGVSAAFDDGSTAQADLAVGCDGMRSATRALVMPDAPAPEFTGLYDYGGFARGVPLPVRAGVNAMVFGKRAFFGAFPTPSGEVWWFHNGAVEAQNAARECLLGAHAEDPPWILELIRSTPEILGPWPLCELRALSRWSRGNVCLLGDAAHAMPPSAGQGASLALEDAMILAMCLRDIPDTERAFATFERLRRPRVEAIARVARRNGDGKAVRGRVKLWLRDRMLPTFLKMGAGAQDRSYEFKRGWGESVV